MQKELGLTMHAPAWCRGRRGVRLVGLVHSGVVDERPLSAVVLVADEKVKGGEPRRAPCTLGLVGKEKKKARTVPRELEDLPAAGRGALP